MSHGKRPKNLALVSQSNAVTINDLQEVAAAIQIQIARDFAPIWNIHATMSVFSDLNSIPTGFWPIIVRDDIGVPSAGGFHSIQHRQPFALIQAGPDWIISTSHETIEMLVDPSGNYTVTADSLEPDQGRVLYLWEACDPCEDGSFAYSINGVTVSDFVTPDYHDPVTSSAVRYSFTGSVQAPRQVLTGGYISWFDPQSQHLWQAFNTGKPDLQFVDRGPAPGGFSLREFIDSGTPHPEGYSRNFAANKIFGNMDADTRKKSSSASARIWEEDIRRVTKR